MAYPKQCIAYMGKVCGPEIQTFMQDCDPFVYGVEVDAHFRWNFAVHDIIRNNVWGVESAATVERTIYKERSMAENAQTMTEFTYAPGEKNIVGDRFSPSVIIFWLKTSIAASSTRVQYKAPNTLFGLIPLGAATKTIPLRNIASVDTNTKFNLGSLVWGLIFLFVGFGMFSSSALMAVFFLLIAVANFVNVMSATLVFRDPSGGANVITVSGLEKDKLMNLAQEIQARVFADADQLRHEENMRMAEKQYTAQTNSVLIQQQMLANQQAAQQTQSENM